MPCFDTVAIHTVAAMFYPIANSMFGLTTSLTLLVGARRDDEAVVAFQTQFFLSFGAVVRRLPSPKVLPLPDFASIILTTSFYYLFID